jgi:hypothetical protein
MAVQVGSVCFASEVEAAPHACATFQPVSGVAGSQLVTIGCSAANADGTLSMYRSVADSTGSGTPTVSAFTQSMVHPPCVESDYLTAYEGVAGAVLGVVCAAWGLWRIAGYLGWGRADQS